MTAEPSQLAPPRPRLAGVDAARGVALLGMMIVHVLPVAGFAGVVHHVAAGRSAALFATLAGVGLALASGGSRVPRGDELARARKATLARAGVVAVVGLTLGGFPTPAAVILVYYGVLFLVAVPVLGRPWWQLAIAAAVWAVASPVVSHLLRLDWGRRPGANLHWGALADPLQAASSLLLTGYYPVLTWCTYLFAGLAVGRLPLGRASVAARLAVVGAVLAVAGWVAAYVVVRLAGGEDALGRLVDPDSSIALREDLLGDTFYGTTPTTSPWFLGVGAPHSGAIPDLVHTTGTSLLVLGVALLLAPRAGRRLTPLVWVGSSTLTLYSVHVVLLGVTETVSADPEAIGWPLLFLNVAVALLLASLWRSQGRRGPLEQLAATAAALAAGEQPAGERAAGERPAGERPAGGEAREDER